MLYRRVPYLFLGLFVAFSLNAQTHGRVRSMERSGVLTVNPLNGAEGIALNQRVVIRLANPVDPERVGPHSVRLVSQQGAVAATRAVSENRDSITIVPEQLLEPFSTYTVLLSQLDSPSENPGVAVFRSVFQTGGSTQEADDFFTVDLPDYIEGVVPTVPRLIVEFDRPIDPATVNSQTVWIYHTNTPRVPIRSKLDLTGRVLIVEPLVPLAVGQTHEMTIYGARDLWGGEYRSLGGLWRTGYDLASPTLEAVLTSFPDEMPPLPTNIVPMVEFNRPVDLRTVNSETARLIGPVGSIPLEPVRRSDLVVTFHPAEPLQPNTPYLFYVSHLRDLSGLRQGAPITIPFTTSGGPDHTPPSLVSVNPTNQRAVPPTSPVTVVVDEPLNPIVLGNMASGGSTVLDVSLSADGRTVTAAPRVPYSDSFGSVRIQFQVFEDLAGNHGTGGPTVSFNLTAIPIVDELPTVLSTVPAPEASGVGPRPLVQIRVSEPPDPATVNDQTVFLAEGGGPGAMVPAQRQLRRDFPQYTVTLAPDINLTPRSAYEIVFRGVRDLDGNFFPDTITPFRTSPDGNLDTVTPKVAAIEPADGAMGVDIGTEIRVTFDKAIHPDATSRLKWALGLAQPLQDWPASAEIQGSNVLVLKPLIPLQPESQYNFRINGVPNLNGSFSLSEPEFRSVFHTGPGVVDEQPPSIVATYPEDGAAGIPTYTRIQIRFSEPIKPAPPVAVIVQDVVDGDVANRVRFNFSYSSDYTTLELAPAATDMEEGALVAVGLGEGLTDLSGNPLPPATFSFTLAEGRPVGESRITEYRPPPAADSAPGGSFLAILDRPLRRAAVGEDVFVSSDGRWTPGASELLLDGHVIRFRPNPEPAPGSRVDVRIVKRAFNNWDDEESTFFFVKPSDQEAAPRVLSISPDGAFAGGLTPRNFRLQVRFSEPVDLASMTLPGARVSISGRTIDGAWTADETQTVLSFRPDATWEPNALVIVDIRSGVLDRQGQTVEEPVTARIRVADFTDGAAPIVSAVAPPNNLSGVPLNAWIRVSFNEPIAAASLAEDAIQLLAPDGQIVAGRLQVFPGAYSVALVPYNLLSANTRYAVRVHRITDLAGQPVDPFESAFFTGSQVDVESPRILSASPQGHEQSWPLNSRVSFAFSEPVFAAALHPAAVYLRRFSGPPIETLGPLRGSEAKPRRGTGSAVLR